MAAYDAADIAAQSTPGNDTELTKFNREVRYEYIRENGFAPYMGTSKKSNIIINHLELVSGGKEVLVPYVNQVRSPRKGAGILVGNESKMYADKFNVRPVWVRDAITLRKDQQKKSFINLARSQKHVLKDLASDKMFEMIIEGFTSIGKDPANYDVDNSITENITYALATGVQLDSWNTDNPYRVYYGIDDANRTAGDHATSLAALGAGDVPSAALLDKLISEARARNFATGATARSAIRPVKVEGNREMYVVFCGTKAFNSFKADTVIRENYLHAARTGMAKNRLFQAGDLMYENVIVRNIPELDEFEPTATIGRIFFCGVNALARGVGQQLITTKRAEDDYGFISGVGFEELYSVEKFTYKDKNVDPATPPVAQAGMIDCFVTLP